MAFLSLEIPDDLSTALAPQGQDLSRAVLEASAVEAYRERKITTAQLKRLLGFETGYDLDSFLKAREVWLDYTLEDVERDRESHRQLGF